jgi:coenzyme F420-reducing hydrogenase delta subunit/Pyruvate/2-oxoacid:ferredoxin oxidoreductase delta subunit
VNGAVRAVQGRGRTLLARADAWCNALYTWRYNPLYHTGALVVATFLILVVTGLYLILFYRIGTPYDSVARITEQTFAGQWIRTLHRYVSDVAVVAIVIHAFRMFVQDRAWGPRALAWVSGVILAVAFLVCGWTGYVMVWDVQGQLFVTEGARLFDLLPIFSEPMSRTFVGERDIPSAFFFLNLFAHIAIPAGIALVLWVHLSRLARTRILPPKPLFWGVTGLFTVISVAWPLAMEQEADLLRLPTEVALDVFYGFWLPVTQMLSPGWAWVAVLATFGAALSVPLLTRPRPEDAPEPSHVVARFCSACEQCYHDCPYEAIDMVVRDDGREGYVAWVDPAKCVSCGICSGSCAPMGVGPPLRTGRDQLEDVKSFISRVTPSRDRVVIVGCANSAAGRSDGPAVDADVFPVSCVGALHTSVIEYLIRAGAAGVMVVTCPPRDCWNREGVTWFEERAFEKREAELQDRVDRRRLRVVYAAEMESKHLARELVTFQDDLADLGAVPAERAIEIDAICAVPEVSVAEVEET